MRFAVSMDLDPLSTLIQAATINGYFISEARGGRVPPEILRASVFIASSRAAPILMPHH
jgi:hypothetical protein